LSLRDNTMAPKPTHTQLFQFADILSYTTTPIHPLCNTTPQGTYERSTRQTNRDKRAHSFKKLTVFGLEFTFQPLKQVSSMRRLVTGRLPQYRLCLCQSRETAYPGSRNSSAPRSSRSSLPHLEAWPAVCFCLSYPSFQPF
jgi:hypothetical protein